MIQVQGITKTFGPVTAVKDLTFHVARGEILGFLGPNGAGKTTTMRVLTGFLPPNRGTARVAEHDILQEPLAAKREIGYLPETPPIYPEMPVRGYLDFVARIKGVAAKRRRQRIDEVLERCALEDVASKLSGRLSKGYRQRLGLAQALVHGPRVLILDEPTSGLDPKQINETRALIRSLAGELTVILSTHILPEVDMTCDRVVIINNGRLAAEGTPRGLSTELTGREVLLLTIAGPTAEVSATLRGCPGVASVEVASEAASGTGSGSTYEVRVVDGEDPRRELAARVVGNGFGLLESTKRTVTLEDAYLQAISSEETQGVQPEPTGSLPDHG